MATSTPLAEVEAVAAASRYPAAVNLLVAWHLLSLDAPTVAMVWTWFIAASNGIRLPFAAVLAMGISVWMLYAADRLLDSRGVGPDPASNSLCMHLWRGDLEARHLFHRRHRRAFRFGLALASLILARLVPQLYPQALRLYAVLGALLVGYFLLIHTGGGRLAEPGLPRRPNSRLPKEIAVGAFFSAATFIPTVARNPALRPSLLPAAMLFGVVCSLNCLFIYAWEHPAALPNPHPSAHASTRLALRFLPEIASITVLACLPLTFTFPGGSRPLFAASALSAALLLLLHRQRSRFASTTLRAAADLCLLSPLLIALAR